MDKLLDTSLITQFDFIILSIIGLSVIFGFFKGFVKSGLSFCGLVIAVLLAIELSELFSSFFSKYVISHSMAVVVSAIVLSILFLIIISIINGILFGFIEPICGGIIDRSFGLCFGFIRGCIYVSFVFYLLVFAVPELNVKDKSDVFGDNLKLPKWARNSETLLLLSRGGSLVAGIIPEHFNNQLYKSIIESKDSSGNFNITYDSVEDVKNLNKIFSMLPEAVIDEISEKDLITLQDQMAPAAVKVKILENISTQYQNYVNSKTYYDDKDINNINKRYHQVMTAIEEEIAKYNATIN